MNKNMSIIKKIPDSSFYRELSNIKTKSQCLEGSEECISIIDMLRYVDDGFKKILELEGMDEIMQYGLTLEALRKAKILDNGDHYFKELIYLLENRFIVKGKKVYKIKRLVKSGEYNGNGHRYDTESLNKALDKYVEEGGMLITPFKDVNDYRARFEIYPEEAIGVVDSYDDEYVYVSTIYREDMIKALESEETRCQICTVSSDSTVETETDKKTYIVDRVTQIRLV